MGWVMGFEPTNTGTTIRGLRPLGDTHHMKVTEKMARQKGLVQSRSDSVEPSSATLIRVAFCFRVYRKRCSKNGTPEGTRTPDLLLRRIGQGIFTALMRPFGAFQWGYSKGIFPLVLLRPYRNFLFWVRIWVKKKRPTTKPVTRL